MTDLFFIREGSRASDVLRLVVEPPLPPVNVHRRPLAVAAIVTQLVTQGGQAQQYSQVPAGTDAWRADLVPSRRPHILTRVPSPRASRVLKNGSGFMVCFMEIRTERQLNPVADEVSAVTAVVIPILVGTLYSLKADVVDEVGGRENVKLKMLPRLRRPGDGDCGICFEYAVHDAVNNRFDAPVVERLSDALDMCRVPGKQLDSILFGAEKTGSQQLVDTASGMLTPESSLLSGSRGRPVKLLTHLNLIAAAFRRPSARAKLPQSISGLWKADLFLGAPDKDRWVGTSVKINPNTLEGARGLRIGIVPTREGISDRVRLDEKKNLVVCPLPYDGSFMEIFYLAWEVMQQFLAADAWVPSEVSLPRPAQRQVARYLVDRREFPVLSVVEALRPLAQPELLETQESAAELVLTGGTSDTVETTSVIAPQPRPATSP